MVDHTGPILASGSRFRRQMLERAGVKFAAIPSTVDEDEIKNRLRSGREPAAPGQVAMRLAEEKALQVGAAHPAALVLGADQILACEGEIFSKPPTLEAARQQLRRLRGRTHELETASVLAQGGKIVWRHLETPRMTMRSFSDAFLDAYLDAEGEVLCQTVGAYQFEGRGAQLFSTTTGDLFSVIGLSLLPLLAELRTRGILDT